MARIPRSLKKLMVTEEQIENVLGQSFPLTPEDVRSIVDGTPGRFMPVQKPGRSKQDYATPKEFVRAVERRFGPMKFDLAASEDNAQAPGFFDEEADALKQDWTRLKGNCWLNPPYGDIAPWAEKCAASRAMRWERRIYFLTPASVGANWFHEHVHLQALVLAVRPRLCFDGKNPYPKDCILSVFGEAPGFDTWDWTK